MSHTHRRNTDAMHSSLRCGATTRAGTACKSPAVGGKTRCRMHGGAEGSGAPLNNRNAFKHGLYTAQVIAHRREVNRVLREGYHLLHLLT